MRITNKIMQRNNLANINTNKVLQDDLTNQMSTQKKINRPSDDPVVAIRALRLRSNVTEVTQYYSKNIPDASSWMTVTEDALNNVSTVITNMITQCTKGANGDLTTSDRQIILSQLKALSDEVYATGDADYAGRYVFTGYRTDTSLSFQTNTERHYSLTEQVTASAIDTVSHVNTGALGQWTSANFSSNASVAAINDAQISSATVNRIRLSYDNCGVPGETAADGATMGTPDLKAWVADPALPDGGSYESIFGATYAAANGTSFALTTIKSTDVDAGTGLDPYTYASKNDDAVVYVPDTGELLLGKNVYDSLMGAKDDTTTSVIDESEFRITYEKNSWAGEDLRPEHYFACEATDVVNGVANTITYNQDYLTGKVEKQSIEYDVGFNQTLRVNSTADECFNHAISREVDDLVSAMQQVLTLEELKDDIQKKIDTTSGAADLQKLNAQLEACDKALTYAKDNCQKAYESGITAMQGFLDDANLAITGVGTRSAKLELIQSRMQSQKTTFETLKSENEDVDIAEVAIQLTSASTTYEAALMATGKIMQNTLLNYI